MSEQFSARCGPFMAASYLLSYFQAKILHSWRTHNENVFLVVILAVQYPHGYNLFFFGKKHFLLYGEYLAYFRRTVDFVLETCGLRRAEYCQPYFLKKSYPNRART